MAPNNLALLIPDWHAYGVDDAPASGARQLARSFPAETFIEVGASSADAPVVEDRVTGLTSVASTTQAALGAIAGRNPSRIFTIAGTCGAEVAPIGWLNERYRGDLAVIWLDAHGDLNTPDSSPSSHFHGMVLRTLLGDGPDALVRQLPRRLSPEQVFLAGVRDLDRPEAMFISDSAIATLTPADLRVPDRVAGRVTARGFKHAYVHLDLDVLDPAEFPDALMRTPGGPSVDEVVEVVRTIAQTLSVVGFSVVELSPRSVDAVQRVRQLIDRCGMAP